MGEHEIADDLAGGAFAQMPGTHTKLSLAHRITPHSARR